MARSLIATATLIALFSGSTFAESPLKKSILNYAEHVHAQYAESLARAKVLRESITLFTETPSVMTLEMAKASWKLAREPYGQTEVFRFYNGPIDQDGGPEGLLNSWPLDEAYIDYVAGKPNAGIINDLQNYPVINKELLESLNELDGEKNISTGYHGIEFLLWGQDFSATGPGNRSFEDYTTGTNANRRAEYLNIAADLLVQHLEGLESAWRKDENNYRREFEALPELVSLKKLLQGIIFMAGDELSGERMYVAYDTQGQEDEHSCFSDMTHMDIRWNYQGVVNVVRAAGLLELPELKGTATAAKIENHFATIPSVLEAIPVPFDQAITQERGRSQILTSVESLEALARDLAEASKLLKAPVDY
ncbi:MAG: imelysin family protein [Bdellovibrionota bacterium]